MNEFPDVKIKTVHFRLSELPSLEHFADGEQPTHTKIYTRAHRGRTDNTEAPLPVKSAVGSAVPPLSHPIGWECLQLHC